MPNKSGHSDDTVCRPVRHPILTHFVFCPGSENARRLREALECIEEERGPAQPSDSEAELLRAMMEDLAFRMSAGFSFLLRRS